MASVANIDVEITSIKVNHDEPPPLNEKEIHLKNPETNGEQNDSRVTDPDGAQSPASSTYADCEDQNDISVGETSSEGQSKEINNKITNSETTSTKGDSNVDKQESPSLNKSEDVVTDDNELVDTEKIYDNSKSEQIINDSKTEPNFSIESTEKITEGKAEEKPLDNDDVKKCIPDDQYQEISENEEIYIDEEEYLDDDEHYEELNEKSGPDDECSEEGSDQHEEDRENGDGEEGNEDEAVAQKELDDDEDRRNPQYIPKRGFFYEHDDRTVNTSEDEASEGAKKEAEAKELETAKGKNRRLFPDGRWQHDLYREDEQKPKSAQELIDIYGYDIRNEEAAPKARRRRKYGRGPNKYTRKWDDEGAYAKQMPAKPSRGRNKTSFKKEDYDEDFPAMSEKKTNPEYRSKEHLPPPAPPAKKSYNEPSRNDDYKYRDRDRDDHRTNNQKPNSNYHERARNFSKRIPSAKEHRPPFNLENYESTEVRHVQKTIRNSIFTPNNDNIVRGRGRGLGHGKNVHAPGSFEEGARLQFTAANRGRAKRLPRQSQHYYPSKQVPEEDVQTLTEQLSTADLGSRSRNIIDKQHYGGNSENLILNEQFDAQQNSLNAVSRSKRYSHQRQRLLPEINKNATAAINLHQNLQQTMQPITHSVQNVASGFSQSMAPTHTSMSLLSQNQCVPSPQTVATPLSVTPASISSSSLAVSASLIPLSAPPLTASGSAMSAGAPPLPIMGFFQHPQGFTNQATPAQLYTRDQTVMGGPSNQPVQLVAFLPASPILSNTNHSQTAPPPPPPPPPPVFPTSVMTYQQTTQTPQNAASYNSESYTMPPATLAPIHQPPDVYQSRGGVTYYNTHSQVKPRSPPPPRVKIAIPIVPPPSGETLK